MKNTMKNMMIRKCAALLLAAALTLPLVPAALAAEDDFSVYASSAAEDIRVSPPADHKDGLLKFDDAITVNGRSTTVTALLNEACQNLTKSEVNPSGYTLEYISYISLSALQGTLYDGYIAEGDPGAGVAGLQKYYYNTAEANYRIGDIQFVPNTTFSGQALITYYGYYNFNETVNGVVRTGQRSYSGRIYITVGKQEPGISYSTDGEAVRFSADDFASYSLAVNGRTFRYLTFELPSASCGALYYNYLDDAIYDSEVTADGRYYRSTSPAVSHVYFVPKKDYSGTFALAFSGVDIAGGVLTGQITITVTAYGPDHLQTDTAAFSYTVKSGRSVSLNADDFTAQTSAKIGETFSYLRFTMLPSAASGTLYNDGGTGSSHYAEINRSYYTPANIRFAAAAGYTGAVRLPFVAYGVNGGWYDGVVTFLVTEGTDQPLRYTVEPGTRVSFRLEDFVDACYNATGYDIDRVHFDALPSVDQGMLYVGGSTPVSTNANTYYYKTGAVNGISGLSFLAAPEFSGSIEIPFTGYAVGYSRSNGRLFHGKVTLASSAAGTPGNISYSTTGPAATFRTADFINAVAAALPDPLVSVRFTAPDESAGHLCRNYTSPSRYSAVDTRRDIARDDLSQISFLPKAGSSGTVSIPYTAKDAGGKTCEGTVSVRVTVPTVSSYFSDMSNAVWAIPAVDFFYFYGATNGNSRTGFGPSAEMRRGDFILLLSRSFSFPAAGTESFADVPQDKYYAAAIAGAKSIGVVTGAANERFRPEESITREEAAVYLYRALSQTTAIRAGTVADLMQFPDYANTSENAIPALGALVRLGVFNGDYGRLRPKAALSRAETITILYRALT